MGEGLVRFRPWCAGSPASAVPRCVRARWARGARPGPCGRAHWPTPRTYIPCRSGRNA